MTDIIDFDAPDVPRRYAVIHDEIGVDYGMFLLSRVDVPGRSWDYDPGPWLMRTDRSGIVFHCLGTNHYPAVTIELWTGQPEPPPAVADSETTEGTIDVEYGAEFRLHSQGGDKGATSFHLMQSGTFIIRAQVTGRQRIVDEQHLFDRGTEHWFLQLWPTDGPTAEG